MPGGDRTGPCGEGPQTGRSMGYCSGHDAPGYVYPGSGFRRHVHKGWRFRRGMGARFQGSFDGFYPDYTESVSERTLIENEIRVLKDQMSYLEDKLARVEQTKKDKKDRP